MISKKRSVNISAKFFRKVGYNKPFISSNKPKGDVCLIATERGVIKKEVLESFRRVVTKKLNRLGKISIPLTFNIPCSQNLLVYVWEKEREKFLNISLEFLRVLFY
jgi:ribosomal protein L16/L10AE